MRTAQETGFTLTVTQRPRNHTLSTAGSELVDIIRFLESKGLLCLICGEEAEWSTTWEHGKDEPCCSEHLQKHRKYHERKTENKLYRGLLRRLKALSKDSWSGRRGDPPLDPGGAPASELRPGNVGKVVPPRTQEVDWEFGNGIKGRVKTSRDPLGADVDCYK